jgi:hypothetical protein
MEAARTSETSADIQLRTRQYIPEDSELLTRRRENLKSHNVVSCILLSWKPTYNTTYLVLAEFRTPAAGTDPDRVHCLRHPAIYVLLVRNRTH